MTPAVRGYRLPRQHRDALSHIEKIAATAAHLVSRRVGVRLDHTEIVITTSQMTSDVLIEAHRAMFGHQPAIWGLKRMHQGLCGITTVNKAGILVVINADRCRPNEQLNRTLVHEMVHVAQLSRPGARDVAIRNCRNNYGIDRMSGREARAANQQVDADEREAERLESLASELPAY